MNGEPEDESERHPLLGTIVDDDIPHLVDLPPPPAPCEEAPPLYVVEHRPERPKTYCESCGHVDAHAAGCPRGDALENLAALDAEEAELEARRRDEPEPISPLVRRIGASLLRRFARIVEPKESS